MINSLIDTCSKQGTTHAYLTLKARCKKLYRLATGETEFIFDGGSIIYTYLGMPSEEGKKEFKLTAKQ